MKKLVQVETKIASLVEKLGVDEMLHFLVGFAFVLAGLMYGFGFSASLQDGQVLPLPQLLHFPLSIPWKSVRWAKIGKHGCTCFGAFLERALVR